MTARRGPLVGIAVVLLAAAVCACGNRPLPAEDWKALRESNYRGRKLETMAAKFVRDGTLIGMTEKQLFDLLGPSDTHDGISGRIREAEWCVNELRYLMSTTILYVELDEKGRVTRAQVCGKNV